MVRYSAASWIYLEMFEDQGGKNGKALVENILDTPSYWV